MEAIREGFERLGSFYGQDGAIGGDKWMKTTF
jgi:hypothetical protein